MPAQVIDELNAAVAAGPVTVQAPAQAVTNAAGNSLSIMSQKGNGTQPGGALTFKGAQGGATGIGATVSLVGGDGGITSGAGGPVYVTGGAGFAGNGNGATVYVKGGAPNGSGTAGGLDIDAGPPGAGTAAPVSIGGTNASKISLGKPLDLSIGGSTAAAGANSAGATVLPAATASVYIVTGSDDAKGIRLHASDLVTGRIICIVNAVNNKAMLVYPPTGGSFSNGSADAAYTGASGKSVMVICTSAGGNQWYGIG